MESVEAPDDLAFVGESVGLGEALSNSERELVQARGSDSVGKGDDHHESVRDTTDPDVAPQDSLR